MSGERSCKEYGDCAIFGIAPCNTNCLLYVCNGKTPTNSPKVKFSVGNNLLSWGYKTRDGYKTLNGLKKN